MKTLLVASLAGLAAADWASFSPAVTVYWKNPQCNSTNVAVGSFSGTGCFPVDTTTNTWIQSTGCNFDNSATGYTVWLNSDSTCTTGTSVSLETFAQTNPNVFDNCLVAPTSAVPVSVVMQCLAAPCCQTTGVVVSFAVILGIGLAGLCAYWVWTDLKFKAGQKKYAADMAASIAAEQAKQDSVGASGGFSFGGAAPTVGGTGYTALSH